MIDRRRRQWFPLSALYPHGQMAQRLKGEFGRDGYLVWVLYLAACKRGSAQGVFSYTTEESGWAELGLADPEDRPGFSLDEFFSFTGQLKQTRRTRSGRVTDVTSTHWKEWQDAVSTRLAVERKTRKRAEKPGDDTRTYTRDIGGSDLDLDRDKDLDQEKGAGNGAVVVASGSAQDLVGWFVDEARRVEIEPPRRFVGQLAASVKALLDEGQSYAAVKAGLERMVERRVLTPSLLPNFVVEAQIPVAANGRYGRGMTTSQILDVAGRVS